MTYVHNINNKYEEHKSYFITQIVTATKYRNFLT